MPYRLKMVFLALIAVFASFVFGAPSPNPHNHNAKPLGIFPNGGTDPPPGS
jgi:hypothetical protein